MKRTKIIATIGPASCDERTLTELILAGVNIFRLNFSHGNLYEKAKEISLVRTIASKNKSQVAILADLPGPRLRLGELDRKIEVREGEVFTFGMKGDGVIPLQYDISKHIKKGHKLYINDGLIEMAVVSSRNGIVKARANSTGWISSRKGINMPSTQILDSTFTKEDKLAAEFALNENLEFIALSFVQSAQDLSPLRNLIGKMHSKAKIIAKIERPEAVKNIEGIISASDGVMVARGDLAIETSPAQVPLIQHRIIRLARQQQKPVIVATQMLESMIENPRPTRAEASDVADAVLSQVDAVMLSAESATGKYPVEAVKTMNSIITTVEEDVEFSRYIKINWEKLNLQNIRFNAVVASCASLAYRLKAPVIATGTVTGRTAQLLSSFRPSSLIAALTHDAYVGRQLILSWGVYPVVIANDTESAKFGEAMLRAIRAEKFASKGDTVVLVWGAKVGIEGTTNTIRAAIL